LEEFSVIIITYNLTPITMKNVLTIVLLMSVVMIATQCNTSSTETTVSLPDEEVVYRGRPDAAISSSVTIPAGKKYFFSSGTLGPVVDSTAAEGDPARYGDTKTQAIGILEKFKADLAQEGLGLNDIVFMRVFVAPDPALGKTDFQGWFDAYAGYFGTEENPTKPARSTIGVAQLVRPDRFIEIEMVAVY